MQEGETDYLIPYIGDSDNSISKITKIAFKTEKVKKGKEIYHENLIDLVIYIKEGKLKLVMSNYCGMERILFYIEPNSFCSPVFMQKINQTFNAKIIVAEDGELMFMHKNDYLDCLFSNREMFHEFLNGTGNRMAIMISNLILCDTSKNKVYKFIYQAVLKCRHDKGDNQILLKDFPSRCDLALLTGVHRTNITKYLTELEKMGIIEKVKHDILVKNVDLLVKLIEEENKKKQN